MGFLKQSTASQVIELGPFLDDEDFVTALTGLTIDNDDIKLRKAGGTSHGDKNSGGATHIANGYYHATLDATDTNTVGPLDVHVNATGALPVWERFYVLEEAVYDALFGGSAVGPLLANSDGSGLTALATAAALATVDSEVGVIDGIVDDIKAKTDNLPSDPADASVVAGLIADLDTLIDAILADTAELQTDWADGGRLDLLVDAIKAKTDALPSDPADQSELAGLIGAVDTVVDAIKAVTDKLDDTLEDDGGTYRFTENALEEAPGGGSGGDATEAKQDQIIALIGTPAADLAADIAAVDAALAAVDAALAVVDENVDDIETAIGLVAGVAGPGATPWVLGIDDGEDPIEGARVWVSTDEGMSNVVAGALITDSFGEVTFLLDAGTYYAWVRKDGYNPVLADEFTVS